MLGDFELYYPVIMSLVWMIGTMFFQIWNKHTVKKVKVINEPSVDIFISCYNEADNIPTLIDSLENQTYKNFRIVMIDDKSTDNTLQIMQKFAASYSNIKIIKQASNKGKAFALNTALKECHAKYVLCLDADSVLERKTLKYLVSTIEYDKKIAAVTGRPLVKNVINLLTLLQFIEYISNIDFIKRSQSFFTNHLYTVSGVLVLFRKEYLDQINGWSTTALTEDINITWRFYDHGYSVVYQPKAICYIYVPGTIKGFLKQRLRWARGGIEVLSEHFKLIPQMSWEQRLLSVDMIASYFWIFLVSFSLVGLLLEYIFLHNLILDINIVITYYLVTILYYLLALIINRKYNIPHLSFYLVFIMPFFFYIYWLNNVIVNFLGFYHIFDRVKFAAWGASDRGKRIK